MTQPASVPGLLCEGVPVRLADQDRVSALVQVVDPARNIGCMSPNDAWISLAHRVGAECRRLLPDLVGVYVHGSAALGGLTSTSDLDVLVVTATPEGIPEAARALLDLARGERTLELSIVAAEAAATPTRPWSFLVHVNSAEERVSIDDGAGDPDLLAHYAVTRAHGRTVTGSPPATVIGPVVRSDLVGYFAGELRWAQQHEDQRYAVLNACRAVAYAETGVLISKIAGGRWWMQHCGHHPLVEACLTAQERGCDVGPCDEAARAFVAGRITQLQHATTEHREDSRIRVGDGPAEEFCSDRNKAG